jgi:hypothetical protein
MTFVNDPTDPANMSPEARLAEVAAILAGGVLRLRRRAAIPAVGGDVPANEPPLESEAEGLDERAETRLHGHRG